METTEAAAFELLLRLFFLALPACLSASIAKLMKIYSSVVWATEYSEMANSSYMSSIIPKRNPIEKLSLLVLIFQVYPKCSRIWNSLNYSSRTSIALLPLLSENYHLINSTGLTVLPAWNCLQYSLPIPSSLMSSSNI